jgi:hypothetical protein
MKIELKNDQEQSQNQGDLPISQQKSEVLLRFSFAATNRVSLTFLPEATGPVSRGAPRGGGVPSQPSSRPQPRGNGVDLEEYRSCSGQGIDLRRFQVRSAPAGHTR